ncbi:hypothetical protein JZU51_01555, partial [bacterium]|nr:hypothetical protein [bacterium]
MSTDGGHTWEMLWSIGNENYQYLDRLAIGVDKRGNYYISSAWGLRPSQSDNEGIDWKTNVDFAPPATFASAGSVYSYCD